MSADLFTLLGTIFLGAAFILHIRHVQHIHEHIRNAVLTYAKDLLEAVIELQKHEARRLLRESKHKGQARLEALKKRVDE